MYYPMQDLINHLRYFTIKLPHRGSTTIHEKKASGYAFKTFKRLGYAPQIQPFSSAKSAYYPALLFFSLMIVSSLMYLLFPTFVVGIGTMITMIISITSILLDSSFQNNLLSIILPKGSSQNIVATLDPRGPKKRALILIAYNGPVN